MDYRKYIGSERWRTNPARLAELDGAKGRCRICFGTAADGWPLEVHHATYARLGCEAVGDLLAVCGDCHREVTSFLRARRYAGHPPLRADVMRVHDIRRPLFDPSR